MSAETTLRISRQVAQNFIVQRLLFMGDAVLGDVISAIIPYSLIDPSVGESGEDDEEFIRRTS